MTNTMGWVSAAESKPGMIEPVLVAVQDVGAWFSGYWDGSDWRECQTGEKLQAVTHWAVVTMPCDDLEIA